ncbi:NUDIX domain-containing protein [Halomonas sp. 86]|uniref:NUDIX domain-containing protein n=1 Tax=unclassified Halomonas TaxID=2609666 RepID=UPI00403456E6
MVADRSTSEIHHHPSASVLLPTINNKQARMAMNQPLEARRWVRLVIVNAEGKLLLLADHEHQAQQWGTVGGSVLPEEDYPAAAMRVLEANTGLECPLGPLLREYESSHSVQGEGAERECERYFLVRCPDTHDTMKPTIEVSQNSQPAYRWWTLAEMNGGADDVFKPSWLPALLASVLVSEPLSGSSPASV